MNGLLNRTWLKRVDNGRFGICRLLRSGSVTLDIWGAWKSWKRKTMVRAFLVYEVYPHVRAL
jgi:hypothetical protein